MTPKELAAAIRKGHTMIGESKRFMHDPDMGQNPCGCALTAAWYGAGLDADYYWGYKNFSIGGIHKFVDALGIPLALAKEIDYMHCGGKSRLKIADWLDTLPDETPLPPKVERESDADYATRMLLQITKPHAELLTVESKS